MKINFYNKKNVFIIFISVLVLYCSCANEIQRNKGITTGKITDIGKDYRSWAFLLFYTYQVDGKRFVNHWSGRMISGKYIDEFKDKSFIVVYSTKDPENSSLVIFPNEYEIYDLVFPDSLSWVIGKDRY